MGNVDINNFYTMLRDSSKKRAETRAESEKAFVSSLEKKERQKKYFYRKLRKKEKEEEEEIERIRKSYKTSQYGES